MLRPGVRRSERDQPLERCVGNLLRPEVIRPPRSFDPVQCDLELTVFDEALDLEAVADSEKRRRRQHRHNQDQEGGGEAIRDVHRGRQRRPPPRSSPHRDDDFGGARTDQEPQQEARGDALDSPHEQAIIPSSAAAIDTWTASARQSCRRASTAYTPLQARSGISHAKRIRSARGRTAIPTASAAASRSNGGRTSRYCLDRAGSGHSHDARHLGTAIRTAMQAATYDPRTTAGTSR